MMFATKEKEALLFKTPIETCGCQQMLCHLQMSEVIVEMEFGYVSIGISGIFPGLVASVGQKV